MLTAKVPSQLPPPPQRPNTPSKALQRPTTLALNTVFQTCHITRIAITISTESSRQEAQRLHRHSESWRRRSTNKTSIGYNLCTSDHSSTKRCDQNWHTRERTNRTTRTTNHWNLDTAGPRLKYRFMAPSPWNLKKWRHICCRPTKSLKFSLAPSALAVDTLYFSLQTREKTQQF